MTPLLLLLLDIIYYIKHIKVFPNFSSVQYLQYFFFLVTWRCNLLQHIEVQSRRDVGSPWRLASHTSQLGEFNMKRQYLSFVFISLLTFLITINIFTSDKVRVYYMQSLQLNHVNHPTSTTTSTITSLQQINNQIKIILCSGWFRVCSRST